ncbi:MULTISPECIES: hypothetical protein [unclassified Nosocomiicoccus]|uniref:hypothetical protein n=1 Tax=unclassified Nosocomiicoccus TaxID=2646683 RepID=UPI0011D0F2EC|nr:MULTISPECIES: hypothetical protein [unclassified Nosocomiicoccus]
MIINIDKYLIKELNENGFDITEKQLVDIYRTSRKRWDFIERLKKENISEEEAIKKYDLYALRHD